MLNDFNFLATQTAYSSAERESMNEVKSWWEAENYNRAERPH